MRKVDKCFGVGLVVASAAMISAAFAPAQAFHYRHTYHAGSWRTQRFGARDGDGLRFVYSYRGGRLRRAYLGYSGGRVFYGYGYLNAAGMPVPYGQVYPQGYYTYPYGRDPYSYALPGLSFTVIP